MCIFFEDDDDNKATTTTMDGDDSSNNSGSPKLQLKNHRTWLIPRKILTVILMVAVLLVFLGMVLMAIGGGIGSAALKGCGGVMFGFGIIGIIVCVLICLYAYFYYGRKDAGVQTGDLWIEDSVDALGYASVGRPSALKDSTLKRNGMSGQKKVTMAPGVGPYGEFPPNGGVQGVEDRSMSSGDHVVYQEAGAGAGGGAGGATKNTDPRGVGGRTLSGSTEVGTGGIRIMPQEQPFPSPGGTTLVYPGQAGAGQAYSMTRDGQVVLGSQQQMAGGGGHAVYSAGGSSASSSVVDAGNYAYPRHVIQGGVAGGEQMGMVDGSGSQYSTLRSIPVTHIMSDQQRQQQLHRQQQDTVEYARVNKPVAKGGSLPVGSSLSSASHSSYVVQGQGHVDQRFPVEEDMDYDNPVERTPMIPQSGSGTFRQRQSSNTSSMSYHEQQMQFQRQKHRLQQQQQQQQQQQRQQQQQQFDQQFRAHHTQDELHAPRQVGTQSLQRQYAANPYLRQQAQQQKQQQQYHNFSASSSSHRGQDLDDFPPEPQPLAYPSARRPMTFEQVSSSKMSVYDNVLAGMKDIDEEE